MSSVSNSALDNIQSNYQPQTTESSSDSSMGQEEFLTLLVAQLENQNPMDPADTSQFTDQLAQFSQVEQLIYLNEKADLMMAEQSQGAGGQNAMDYIGKQVTGNANTMNIDDGGVSGGFYDLPAAGDVVVVIQNDEGNTVNTLYEGQKDSGAYLLSWDGTDVNGVPLDDGAYSYTVMVDSGSGYEEIPSNITGTVEGVVTQNGTDYLVVGGLLLDPDNLTSVFDPSETGATNPENTPLDYLGKTVETHSPILQVDEGQVAGSDLSFHLDTPQDVSVNVYDAQGNLIQTIEVPADQTTAGDNSVHWDALDSSGSQVSDGVYTYSVSTENGSASTPVEGEVSGVQYINGLPFLELGETGRLVSLSDITKVK
ncbi:MAG: T9SS type A sorting domain-containing protein [Desulfobacterales bacterium]|nr:T9SS type A sorting domain-containing protein [Desulfobacterales bacterium]